MVKSVNAIILAAGIGNRMVPINMDIPKALLLVDGEPLIERQIRQLHAAGITDITIVIGYMKERFRYLVSKFHVHLVINPEFKAKNNLYSLSLVKEKVHNTYIIPADIWCRNNPFQQHENRSWYMMASRNNVPNDETVIGIAYLSDKDSVCVRQKLEDFSEKKDYDSCFWEETLYQQGNLFIDIKTVSTSDFVEINTYEQLRDLDKYSECLKNDALDVISKVMQCSPADVTDILVLKKGMTNRSFFFKCGEQRYIMRIPGEGTEQLINRRNEAEVYRAITGRGLCDAPIYMNPDNGYKITKFLKNVRTCDPYDESDVMACMGCLRRFHNMKIKVSQAFDLFQQVDFYQNLWETGKSRYHDYETTKEHIGSLKGYIDAHKGSYCLTHIDANPDNFLFYDDSSIEKLQLTDWEYAGMQDPDVDVAMFGIYSIYNKEQMDHLIDIYCENRCSIERRLKIYCYIAVCGLLWSNWCEYKKGMGIEFGEYANNQYSYAKEYYRYIQRFYKGAINV